jgi:transcriptional regulator with XRE-family HTH domain
MRYAARRVGLTAHEIRQEMGLKTQEAVYRWWGGDRAPKPQHLTRYAEVVGETVAYFYQPSDPPPISEARVRQVVAEAEREVSQGQSGARGELREFLVARLGKDLDQLTPGERREVLWELAEIMVARNPEEAPAPVPPDVDALG